MKIVWLITFFVVYVTGQINAWMFNGRPLGGKVGAPKVTEGIRLPDEQFYDFQRVNHFDGSDFRYWKQVCCRFIHRYAAFLLSFLSLRFIFTAIVKTFELIGINNMFIFLRLMIKLVVYQNKTMLHVTKGPGDFLSSLLTYFLCAYCLVFVKMITLIVWSSFKSVK